MNQTTKILVVLSALILPALLVGLDVRPVYKIQEVRIAETAREMVESGDWLLPRYNGELRLQKPPLPYWLTATSYQVMGVSAAATRLPAALAGLCLAFLIFFWVQRESGLKTAANCVMALIASYLGLRYFRSGEADAVLLFFISAACFFGFEILQGRCGEPRRALFGLMLGLGFLSKGPAALAIPLSAVFAAAVVEKRAVREVFSLVTKLFSFPGVALLSCVAFGWYVWILWQLPDIAQNFFGKQVDETFISGTHAQPLWWYPAHFLEFYAPWGLLLIPAALMAFRQRGIEGTPALVRFAWVWLTVVFILLTATINKQTQYALLFAPPLAIILGHYLANAREKFALVNRILFWIFCTAALMGVAYSLYKSSVISHALIWLAIPVTPLVLLHLFRESDISLPVLLVAGVTTMTYLYSEAYLSKEPRKLAAQTLMQQAAQRPLLYQPRTPLNDGALSFYAGRVVPPASEPEIASLLNDHAEIWVVGENVPTYPGTLRDLEAEVQELKLYRLRRKP